MLSVLAVPAFQDNYFWLIHDGAHAAVVDPGDAAPVRAALQSHRLRLTSILLTHHHADHAGGVSDLLASTGILAEPSQNIPVFGPRTESIPGITHPLSEGDQITLPLLGLNLSVLDVPGHTRGHIAYVALHQDWLFCGDTLFAGGCGRLFEGTPQQMLFSLAKFSDLPDTTLVYCAHEYTLSNLRFALEVEPGNAALIQRFHAEEAKRAQGIPTVPSTMGIEKATNPFLRHTMPEIIDRLKSTGRIDSDDPVTAFAALREWKNSYR